MLPILRPLKAVRLDVHKRTSALNAHRTVSSHTRVYKTGPKAGTTRTVTRYGPRVICDGAKTTLVEVLLPLARAAAQHMLSTPLLWDQLVTDTGLLSPRIEVSGHDLAQHRDVCARTTRNHLKQLKQHGFISAYKFRGREHRFYLWINPALVWEMPVENPKTAFSASSPSTPPPADFSTNGKYFPHNEVPETQETQKRIVVAVDKLALQPGQEPTGNPSQETQGHRDAAGDAGQAAKSRLRGRAAARQALRVPVAQPSPEAATAARIEAFVREFWALAKPLLYPNHTFTPAEERKILTAIWNGQYQPTLQTAAPAIWDRLHAQLLHRQQLVWDHLQLHPERYLPLPYAVVHRGTGYFDAENAQGFAGTRLWLARKMNRPKGGLSARDKALQVAETELRQRLALDRGEKVKCGDRVKRKDILALHWHHRTEIKRIGGEQGLVLYHARLGMLGLAAAVATAQA